MVSGLGEIIFLMHKDLNVFILLVFKGLCRFENIYWEGQIKILEGGSSQMITVLRFLIEGGQAK